MERGARRSELGDGSSELGTESVEPLLFFLSLVRERIKVRVK
jgi:hypothetical protein